MDHGVQQCRLQYWRIEIRRGFHVITGSSVLNEYAWKAIMRTNHIDASNADQGRIDSIIYGTWLKQPWFRDLRIFAILRRPRLTRLESICCIFFAALSWIQPSFAENTTYYVTDAQGTVVAKMDTGSNVTYDATYRPYGKQQNGSPQAGPGYTGHENDPSTGLVYMQARYYDPGVGRFLSRDPVAFAGGNVFKINAYAYVSDNPILYTDPTGMVQDSSEYSSEYSMASPGFPADQGEPIYMGGSDKTGNESVTMVNTSSNSGSNSSNESGNSGNVYVFVYYKNEYGVYSHTAIVIQSSDGNTLFVVQAKPSNQAHIGGAIAWERPSRSDSAQYGGHIVGYVMEFNKNNVPSAYMWLKGDTTYVQYAGAIHSSLIDVEQKLTSFTNNFNNMQYPYWVYLENSNTFTWNALKCIGIRNLQPVKAMKPIGWNGELIK